MVNTFLLDNFINGYDRKKIVLQLIENKQNCTFK